MVQFTALDPRAEVSGAAILSTLAGMGSRVDEIMARHGLVGVTADGWYPQQAWLDVLRSIYEGEGPTLFDMVSIGMKIPETALWPPEIDTVEAALASIDMAYHMNHRNGEIGHYRAETVGERHMQIICDNPYPSDFDYGIIYATVRRFMPEGWGFTLVRADTPSRLKGDDCCIYEITWGPSGH